MPFKGRADYSAELNH